MSPAQYLAAARDIIILLAIGILLWWVYRDGKNAVKATDLKSLQTQIQQQARTLEKWRGESNDAQAKLSKDVAAINAAAADPVVHNWLPQPACPKPAVLPTASAQARPEPSSGGGTQPIGGEVPDGPRRDSIVAAFKQRWETEFAKCRALDAQWPQL